MNYRIITGILGRILAIEAFLLLAPLVTALIYGETPLPFVWTILLTLAAAAALLLAGRKAEGNIQPRYITAQQVLQYVRSMANASDSSGVEMLRRILDGKLEVLEFKASVSSPCLGTLLRDLPTRPDVLLAAIIRDGKCLIPGGNDEIWAGDSVLAVTTRRGMARLDDILRG